MPLDGFRLLGVAMWILIGISGAWLLITGRRMFWGLPKGLREGWPLRVFGLVYCVAAAIVLLESLRGVFNPAGSAFAFAALVVGLIVVWVKGGQREEASGTKP